MKKALLIAVLGGMSVVACAQNKAPADAGKAAAGQPQFAVCSACHGMDGKGNPALGAPNLTDDIWVHGGDLATIEKTIGQGRTGTMPSWGRRLGGERTQAVAAWVFANAQGEELARKRNAKK